MVLFVFITERLMIEIFKLLNNMTDNVYNNIFIRSNRGVNLQYQRDLIKGPFVYSVCKGKNSLRYFGYIIWNSLPVEIRKSETLPVFKLKIKEWKNRKYRLCKEFLGSVGFI